MTTLTLDITLNINITPQANASDSPAPAPSPMPGREQLYFNSAVDFAEEWESGALGLRSGVPCLVTKAYSLYRVWCENEGEAAVPQHVFLSMLKRQGMSIRRERWRGADGFRGPHTFVFPSGDPQGPADVPRAEWLGECVALAQAVFAAMVQDHA